MKTNKKNNHNQIVILDFQENQKYIHHKILNLLMKKLILIIKEYLIMVI